MDEIIEAVVEAEVAVQKVSVEVGAATGRLQAAVADAATSTQGAAAQLAADLRGLQQRAAELGVDISECVSGASQQLDGVVAEETACASSASSKAEVTVRNRLETDLNQQALRELLSGASRCLISWSPLRLKCLEDQLEHVSQVLGQVPTRGWSQRHGQPPSPCPVLPTTFSRTGARPRKTLS